MAAQVANVTQRLTTAVQMRETTQMLMQPDANWETFLSPAPLSIAIMVELVFFSSATDFSINKNPPADGYKHIRYPDSFRACLMQVCNTGWQAFNTAHKNMDQIRIYTGGVPKVMKSAVKLLFSGNYHVIKDLLPTQLENLSKTANECVTLSESVEQKFSDFIKLIQELLEACVNAEHFYGEELERINNNIRENKLREEAARELKEKSTKVMQEMERQLADADDAYKRAMDSIPTGWDLVGMNTVESFTQIVGIFTSSLSKIAAAQAGVFEDISGTAGQQQESSYEEDLSRITTCTLSKTIQGLASSFQTFISDKEIDWDEVYDQKRQKLKTSWTKDRFAWISEKLESQSESMLQQSALELVQEGLAICEDLESYSPGEEWDETQTAELIEKVNTFQEDVLRLDSECSQVSGSPSLKPKPPMMFKTGYSGEMSFAQRAMENAQYKVAQTAQHLKEVREAYGKSVENTQKNQKELTDILVQMQNASVTKINFQTTIKMLGKGMEAMGRVKEQWEKMVLFFQMMATIVKTSLGPSIKSFVRGAEKTMNISYDAKLFAQDMIYNQAFEASNIANLVHMIAGTYCEVSQEYLMDRVSKLGSLMVMDKESDEFLMERQRLQNSCKEAEEGILRLVRKKKKEFESKVDSRLAKIEKELKAVLPASSPEETERIEAIVQAGIAKGRTEGYL